MTVVWMTIKQDNTKKKKFLEYPESINADSILLLILQINILLGLIKFIPSEASLLELIIKFINLYQLL